MDKYGLVCAVLAHLQGRALAGESLRLFDRIPGGRKVRLDWYLVDTKEELSAFDGRLLVSGDAQAGVEVHKICCADIRCSQAPSTAKNSCVGLKVLHPESEVLLCRHTRAPTMLSD